MSSSNGEGGGEVPATVWTAWRADLERSREMGPRQRRGTEMAVSWYLKWIERAGLLPGRASAKRFWREAVKTKRREDWQLAQWGEALGWYLDWLAMVERERDLPAAPTLAMRVKRAVMTTGARRGLQRTTCKSYAGACVKFAAFCGTARKMLDETQARDWLTMRVEVEKVSYATQKQNLNALAFFYKDVCGREEVDLGVEFRKTPVRVPVVLSIPELQRLWVGLSDRSQLAAELMYGSGIRVSELMRLRVKDLDFDRRQLVVRAGKGDRDRVTILPQSLMERLRAHLVGVREIHARDRAAGEPGVMMPNALARKYRKANVSWEWYCFSGASRRLTLRAPLRSGQNAYKPSAFLDLPRLALESRSGKRHCATASHGSFGLEGGAEGGGTGGRDCETGHAAHDATYFRDPPPGSRKRHPNRAGVDGARRCPDHSTLHACGAESERGRSAESAGPDRAGGREGHGGIRSGGGGRADRRGATAARFRFRFGRREGGGRKEWERCDPSWSILEAAGVG